jgi:hypothetical protein
MLPWATKPGRVNTTGAATAETTVVGRATDASCGAATVAAASAGAGICSGTCANDPKLAHKITHIAPFSINFRIIGCMLYPFVNYNSYYAKDMPI